MNDTIHMQDLRPGDVLMYHSTDFIGRAIQFFDGSELNHVAVYLAEDEVGEAVPEGVLSQGFEKSIHWAKWVRARRLKDRPSDMSPVIHKAREYIAEGNRYAFEQIFLLAFLGLTRKVKFTPTLRRLVRSVLDSATAVLTQWISMGRRPMICSEFVYRTYDEALPEASDVYSLRIPGTLAVSASGATRLAAAPTARGRGIHPHSLLALFASSSGQAWVRSPMPLRELAMGGPTEVDVPQLKGLIETYLEEVRGEPTLAARPDVTVEDLRMATERFAVTLYVAGQQEPKRALAAMVAVETRSLIYQNLFTTAADFVTPADLFSTPSLFLLGKIEH